MRYLKPNGKIKINNKWHDIIFTLDVIDELQDRTQMPMIEIMIKATSKKNMKSAVKCLLKYLLEEEIELEENQFEYYSMALIKAYIEQIKHKKVAGEKEPALDEEVNHEFIDIEHLIYYGTVELGYPENEVWKMTLGKINTLQAEQAKNKGWIKEDKEVSIDEAIPI